VIGASGSSRAMLQRVNPVAKLLAALVLMVALFVSLDAVTAGIILVALLALTTLSGIPRSVLIGRGWLIALLAISVGLFNVLFAAEQFGPTVATIGPVEIGAETLGNGVGLALRLIAIFLAGTLATATSDPTEVADALIQQARVSPRFAIGVLAALRLVPVLAREWRTIGLARRARGVEAGRSPVAAVRLLAGRLMALLVAAIRRASRMAVAMDARGFGASERRTIARPQRMRVADLAWIAGAIGLSAVAVGTSIAIGTWRPLLG
jgi:energy-coupling factor transport system permease protein